MSTLAQVTVLPRRSESGLRGPVHVAAPGCIQMDVALSSHPAVQTPPFRGEVAHPPAPPHSLKLLLSGPHVSLDFSPFGYPDPGDRAVRVPRLHTCRMNVLASNTAFPGRSRLRQASVQIPVPRGPQPAVPGWEVETRADKVACAWISGGAWCRQTADVRCVASSALCMAAAPAALCACVARAPRMRLWLAVPHLIGCMASPALCMPAVLAALCACARTARAPAGAAHCPTPHWLHQTRA